MSKGARDTKGVGVEFIHRAGGDDSNCGQDSGKQGQPALTRLQDYLFPSWLLSVHAQVLSQAGPGEPCTIPLQSAWELQRLLHQTSTELTCSQALLVGICKSALLDSCGVTHLSGRAGVLVAFSATVLTRHGSGVSHMALSNETASLTSALSHR